MSNRCAKSIAAITPVMTAPAPKEGTLMQEKVFVP